MVAKGPASTCEVKLDDTWTVVPLTEARMRYASALKRCPACHGAIYITGNYARPVRLGIAHRKVHRGCPLMQDKFSGVASPHPLALS